MKLIKVDQTKFDPKAPGSGSGIFGLPFDYNESSLIIIPVPWEVTTSYRRGTKNGPKCILEASKQLDLFDIEFHELGMGNPWHYGIHFLPFEPKIENSNEQASLAAVQVISDLEGQNSLTDSQRDKLLKVVNDHSEKLNTWVETQVDRVLNANKTPGILGGDHSVPFGAIKACARKFPDFGILHIDAHADLRCAYEGFTYSHASIMHNVLERISEIKKLVQVGIRDFSEEEFEYSAQNPKIKTFYDSKLHEQLQMGITWEKIAKDIIKELPKHVWVSFDIDGLDPALCPNTGTPVPGGLQFRQIGTLLKLLAASGKKVVGFDLNEVANGADSQNDWDANVGARILYKLIACALASQLNLKDT